MLFRSGDELRVDCSEGAEELNFTPIKAKLPKNSGKIEGTEEVKALAAPKKSRSTKSKSDKKGEE